MNSFNNASQLARQRLIQPLKNNQQAKQQALLAQQNRQSNITQQQTVQTTSSPKRTFYQELSGETEYTRTRRQRQLAEIAQKRAQQTSIGQATYDFVGDITGERQKQLTNKITSYQSNVTSYNQKVQSFDADVAKLNELSKSSNPADKVAQQTLFNDLQTRKSTLQGDYLALQKEEADIQTSEKKMYSTGMYSLLGYDKIKNPEYSTQSMSTYGIYTAAKEKADWWGDNVVSNVKKGTSGLGIFGDFITGVSRTPSILTEIGGMIPAGVERATHVAGDLPAYAVAGIGLQGQSMYKGVTERPAEFAGELLGTALVAKGVRGGIGRGYGATRTIGKTYVPVESLGYDTIHGYPLGKTSTASLQKSFTESRLVPAPYKMAGAGNTKVPYTPKTSRLPTDTPGTPQMWTAWENRLKPDTPLGTTATVGKGSSEIGGMYGAPVALTYFTKAGNKSPKLFGLDFPSMKRPSLLRTTVSSLEAIPNKLSKETLSLKASGTGTEEAYAAINAFLKQNADPGKAYFPNTKAEYEAVLPEGNVLSLKGSQYYTKVAGGHRVPIYEFETTGEIISGKTKSTGKGRFSGKKSGSDYLESLEPKPYISGFNLLSSIIGVSGRGSKSLTRRYKLDRYVDYSYSAIEHASSSYALKSRGLSSLKSLGYSFLGSSVLRSGSSVKSYPGSSLQYPKSFSKAMPLGYYGYPNTYDKDFTFSKIDSSGNQIRQHKPKSRQKNWNFIEFYPLADVNKLLRF